MKIKRRLVILFALAAAAVASASGENVAGLLARAKQVSGGPAWDDIRSVHVKARVETGGMTGVVDSWDDVVSGRNLTRFTIGPASGAQGFDGKLSWSQDASGQSRADDDTEAGQSAADSAYLRCMAFWYPSRWEAGTKYSGLKSEGGRNFHILEISPRGGRAFHLWIDADSYLFDRVIEGTSVGTQTTFFSDYRRVSGVLIAYGSRVTTGKAKYDQVSAADLVEVNVPLDDAMFAIPAPPAADFAIAGGRTSTEIPFRLHNNHIFLEARINGAGPFEFLCDTGGANVMTPELARDLGLKIEGTVEGRGAGEKSEDVSLTRVDRLEIGKATISNQLFFIFPLSSMARVEGRSLRGLIGYEVFKRFVVRIDYEKELLTLVLPSAFVDRGDGAVVPFTFHGNVPQVDGELDGIPGKFDLDTGSRSSLTVMRPFAEKNDLKSKYGAKVEAVTGWGVGGEARALVTRAGVLDLGGVTVRNPVTELSLQKKGAFADPYVAGNVGAGVLKRFNLVFDYGHKVVIFEKNARYGDTDEFDRAGMWINQDDRGFLVVSVVPGGPAAEAGVKAGDLIIVVDGKPPSEITLAGARGRFRSDPPGTKIELRIASGGRTRNATMVLRDLVAPRHEPAP